MKAKLDKAWAEYQKSLRACGERPFNVSIAPRPVSTWLVIHRASQHLPIFLRAVRDLCGDDVLVECCHTEFIIAGVMVFRP